MYLFFVERLNFIDSRLKIDIILQNKDTALKQLFGILFVFSGLILFLTIRKCREINNPMINAMRYLFYSAILATLSNLIVLLSQNRILSLIFYSLFFIGIDGLLFFLLTFTLRYVNIKINLNKTIKITFYIFLADSISLILNIFFLHAFDVTEVMYRGAKYLLAEHYIFYNIHLIISYATLGIVFVLLFIKALTSPKMYKVKYLSLLIAFLVVSIGDAFYVFLHIPIDFSVILFSTTGIVYYYITFHFTPHTLIEKALSLVVENMEYAVIFFDNEGKSIYKNKSFEELFYKYQNLGIINNEFTVDSWIKTEFFKDEIDNSLQNHEFNKAITINNLVHYFNIKYHNLTDDNNKLIGSFFLIQDRTKDEEKIQYERYLSTHDNLTQLYNKYYFYDQAKKIINENPNEEYYMISTKINNFNFINETFGNYVVEQFIQKISLELKKIASQSDVFGRLKNDNFALLMKKKNFNLEKIREYTEKISSLSEDKYFPVKVFLGIYEVEDPQIPISVMCDRANMAISDTRSTSTENILFYNLKIKNQYFFEQTIVSEFPKALLSNQFKVFVQPQFTKNKELYGGEVLVRWLHPIEGFLYPEQFIYLFENNGLITQLDMYIWEETAKILHQWNEMNVKAIPLSVNISPKDLCYIDIFTFFVDLVKKYQIQPNQLKLEITETGLKTDKAIQVSTLKKLQDAGFIVELDDFGTGSSSLNILTDFVFDKIKFDLSFFKNTENLDYCEKIISTIVELTNKLGIALIIEGVETEEQFNFLQEVGCNLFQGFYFERPIEIASFEKKYIQAGNK